MRLRQSIAVHGQDTLAAVRTLLGALWQALDLEGMVLPVWKDDATTLRTRLLSDPTQLESADPFAPLMSANHAPLALQTLRVHPQKHLAVFLRPCEWRSFRVLVEQSGEPVTNVFSLSADCTGAMTAEDFAQQARDDPLELTRQVLHFASQGGILPSRRQSSCQLCEDPFPVNVDLHLELFGIRTDAQLVFTWRDSQHAQQVSQWIQVAPVPQAVVARREQVLADLTRWRAKSFQKRTSELGAEQLSLEALLAHLRSCETCQATLRGHCPLIDLERITEPPEPDLAYADDWLGSCSGCGVCDHACPQGYPLFAVIFALRANL